MLARALERRSESDAQLRVASFFFSIYVASDSGMNEEDRDRDRDRDWDRRKDRECYH